jgi:hypothetical protein
LPRGFYPTLGYRRISTIAEALRIAQAIACSLHEKLALGGSPPRYLPNPSAMRLFSRRDTT